MIRSAAVLGAGTMGAQIAAHFANAGLSVVLLDMTREAAAEGLKRAQALKPDPFVMKDGLTRVSVGGFESDLARIAEVDWIVEAIVERLDAKQALLARVDAVRKATSIVSSNTSGIPIASIAESRSESFRQHWIGTHFFNPPRYMKLLELTPTTETLPAVVSALRAFADVRLGKGVVIARDTPNFIANRIGMFAVIRCLELLASGRYTIEEIDAITGPAIGRPKSATFRTLDLAGIDILAQVSRNLKERLGDEATTWFALPPIVDALVERGWTGEKAGQGFYRREKRGEGASAAAGVGSGSASAKTGAGGKDSGSDKAGSKDAAEGSEILTLDPETLTYRARQPPRLPSIEAAKSIDDVGERLRTLFLGKDKVGEFMRQAIGPSLVYAARVAPDIAHSIDDVDRAMQWGFGWEIGPFETIDAIGLRELIEACCVTDVPPLMQARLDAGENTFRAAKRVPPVEGTLTFRVARDGGRDGQTNERHGERPAAAGASTSASASNAVVKKNAGASLIDLGDGVLGVELHTKMNAIGGDTIAMLTAGVKEAEKNFAALVVSSDAVNFSVGANLALLLLEAQEGNWDEIDLVVRAFQKATMALRLSAVPVVLAPAGMVLGGGCEMALHADRLQAAGETYIGLVEVGVGIIPAGGGTKELVARAAAQTLGEANAGSMMMPANAKSTAPASARAVAGAETIAVSSASVAGAMPAPASGAHSGGSRSASQAVADATTGPRIVPGPAIDLLPAIQRAFETIGFAKVSASAAEARQLGFLRATDRITMNRDRLLADAKALALSRVQEGYQAPVMRTAIPVGGAPIKAALDLGIHLAERGGRISEHDARVGRALAHIMAGGALPHAALVSEQHLLDLEREAFLSLMGQKKTLERMQYTLKTGKPLRN